MDESHAQPLVSDSGAAASGGPVVRPVEPPDELVRRFLTYHAERKWEDAIALMCDECLEERYGPFQEACHDEAASRYGYRSPEAARGDKTREFVRRMLRSSSGDSGGMNPAAATIPQNADCHIRQEGDEVIVTYATPYAATRTRYRTLVLANGSRRIRCIDSAHTTMEE